MGKGVVDERDALFLGNTALSSNDFVHRAIEAADLIINVGHDVVEKPPFFACTPEASRLSMSTSRRRLSIRSTFRKSKSSAISRIASGG